jgi:predicted chitinase
MPPTIALTLADLTTFAPRMAPFYRDTLLSPEGQAILAQASILASGRRLAHFMAQFGAETGGGTVLRESLTYTSVERIKQVWPARAASFTETELRNLVRNPVALGDWAYGGRLGNRKGTSDGYDFRGGGWLQITGRANVAHFCSQLGILIRPDILDDPVATLRFACAYWTEKGCNALADADDLLGVSRAINTGSATSGITPVGMEHREEWFHRAYGVWWERVPVDSAADSTADSAAPEEPEEVIEPPAFLRPAPAAEPPPKAARAPSRIAAAVKTVNKSTSVWALINAKLVILVGGVLGGFKAAWDYLLTVLDVLPAIVSDVGGTLEQGKQVSQFLSLSAETWMAIAAVIALPLIVIAAVRHTRDKQALEQTDAATPTAAA